MEPPRRQSARRTRNILPESLQETETAGVPQERRLKRTAGAQTTAGLDVDANHHGKRPKTAHEGGMKEQESADESSELTEPEETEAVIADSKDDDISGKSDSPEEDPEQVCECFLDRCNVLLAESSLVLQEDVTGYPPAWFTRPESEEHLDSDHSDASAFRSSPLYRLHMQSKSYEDQTAMREDIRRINLYINGVKENYAIVDRLGEGRTSC